MCRTRGQLSRVVSGLADHGIDAVQTKNAELASHEQVSVMTMHGAKGMERTGWSTARRQRKRYKSR